jgi:hypothetical protein
MLICCNQDFHTAQAPASGVKLTGSYSLWRSRVLTRMEAAIGTIPFFTFSLDEYIHTAGVPWMVDATPVPMQKKAACTASFKLEFGSPFPVPVILIITQATEERDKKPVIKIT